MAHNELTIDQLKAITGSAPLRGAVEALQIGKANWIRDTEDNCNVARPLLHKLFNPWNHPRYNIQGRAIPKPWSS